MAKLLEMPKLSPTMEEGQLSVWHKKEGDEIAIDDLLAEVETDKATMEFRSFDKGTLLKLLVTAGSMVKLGQPVAILGKPGEDFSALLGGAGGSIQGKAAEPSGAKGDQAPEGGKPEKPAQAQDKPAPDDKKAASDDKAQGSKPAAEGKPSGEKKAPEAPSSVGEDGRVKASPYVRKLAREHDLDLHNVQGSGPGGRIIARDLEGALSEQPEHDEHGAGEQAAPAAPSAPEKPAASQARAPAGLAEPEARPLSMMRKTIARRLTESKQTVPHFYLRIDADAGALVALREQINQELAGAAKKGQEPEKISLNDLIVRACATALRRVPECNAQFSPEAILVHRRVDISVAVAVPDGLVTPVLRDADRMGVLSIARSIQDLAARAKTKKLAPEEMSNGTFSISNLGMFGIDEFAAVINPPEGAILAVGRVRDEPIVKDGAVVPGKRLGLTLSCDHRVIDGAVGARFLAELRALIERPMQILIG